MKIRKATSIFDRLDPPINFNNKFHPLNEHLQATLPTKNGIDLSPARKINKITINKASTTRFPQTRAVIKAKPANRIDDAGFHLYNSALQGVLNQNKVILKPNKGSIKSGTVGTNSCIFVRNLPKNCTEQRLERLFQEIGQISMLKFEKGPVPTAYVGFTDPNGAELSINQFDGYMMNGSAIKISLAANPSFGSATKNNGEYAKPQNEVGHGVSFLPSETQRISIFDRMS